MHLFLPSTFASCSVGEQHWTHIGIKGDCRRIDFVAAPLRWQQFPLAASVDLGIDLSLAVEDHFAVSLSVDLHPCKASTQRVERRPRLFDAAQMVDPSKAALFIELLEAAPAFPWQLDVHAHAHGLTSYVGEALASAFPLVDKVTAQTREFLSPSTLRVVSAKRVVRRLAARARLLAQRSPPVASVVVLLQHLHSLTASALDRSLRSALKVDRASFASAQAASIADSLLGACPRAAAVAVRVAKAVGSRSKRVLPLLEDEDGIVAADPLAARRIWQSHFSQLDLGSCTSLQQHATGVIAAHNAASFPLPRNINTVCSLSRLERLFATSRAAGTHGEDGIPTGVYRRFAPMMAKLCHS